MMNKKMAVIVSILISIQMLSGCAQTSESPIIRVKEVDAMEHYQEAENLNVSIEKSGAESLELKNGGIKSEIAVSKTLLRTRLGAPKHYQNEVSDATGKLKVFTDADVDIPEVEKVPAIYVRRHDSNQEDTDAITKALFGNTDVYDLPKEIEETQRAYDTASETRELSKLTPPYEFNEELIDPWMPEIGSVRKVYGSNGNDSHLYYICYGRICIG